MIALWSAELLNISTLAEQVCNGKWDGFKDVWSYLTLASAVVLVRRKMTPDPPAGLSNCWFRMYGCTKPKVILILFMCRDQRQSRPWKKPSQTSVKMFNDKSCTQRQKNNSCTVQEPRQATAMKAQQYKGPTFLVFCPFWKKMSILLRRDVFYTPSDLWQL